MYVTRTLSSIRNFPDSVSLNPPDGPNSGILVIQDEEAERYTCFGLRKDTKTRDFPFPQNKNLTVRYSSRLGEHRQVSYNDVILIPVLNQPLSANGYYAIVSHRKHRGEAYVNSREEDMGTCLCCTYVQDVKPKPFDPSNIYQQFQIFVKEGSCVPISGYYYAKSVAPDGFPPDFLRRKGWELYTKTPKNYELGEAGGVNTTMRAQLPEFNFPLHLKSSEKLVVGKWYCPFIFIRDGMLKDQVKNSLYYEMTLEQNWEAIYECEYEGKGNVIVDVDVESGVNLGDKRNVSDGVMWFGDGETRVGLSLAVVERMKWEEERVGWVYGNNNEGKVRVKREEELGGNVGGWMKFGCYVLVERFVLKRMDGSLVLSCDFKHTHQIRSKWE